MNQARIVSTDNRQDRLTRRRYSAWLSCVAILCSSATGALARNGAESKATDLCVSDRMQVASGHMVICWRRDRKRPRHLLIHFHGAPDAVKKPFLRSRLNAVLAVINFPGLSSAYSKPFERDVRLFDKIVAQATKTVFGEVARPKGTQWHKISVSSFSAAYGAVREILKTPGYFAQIDAVVAADSIYAGLQGSSTHREVNQHHMQDFLKFAEQACDGKKTFVLSHSSQRTPYASTTETADYLLRALRLNRTADTSIRSATLRQTSHASRGQFTVLGFDGETGTDHMQHLHNIDLLWNQLTSWRR